MTAAEVVSRLKKLGNKEKAKLLQGFFKTGKGEYGEGDIFVGVMVPESRKLAKAARGMPFSEITKLQRSPIHEARLVAILLLVELYKEGTEKEKERVYKHYLKSRRYVNNWDLVDLSAHKIVGAYLEGKSKTVLYDLVKSKQLWDRRIAVIATARFISNGEYSDTLRLAKMLLRDKEDLMHKAVGWMLREIGKRDLDAEEKFLKVHYKKMPRTMLRYAIERFPERKRQAYLKGRV